MPKQKGKVLQALATGAGGAVLGMQQRDKREMLDEDLALRKAAGERDQSRLEISQGTAASSQAESQMRTTSGWYDFIRRLTEDGKLDDAETAYGLLYGTSQQEADLVYKRTLNEIAIDQGKASIASTKASTSKTIEEERLLKFKAINDTLRVGLAGGHRITKPGLALVTSGAGGPGVTLGTGLFEDTPILSGASSVDDRIKTGGIQFNQAIDNLREFVPGSRASEMGRQQAANAYNMLNIAMWEQDGKQGPEPDRATIEDFPPEFVAHLIKQRELELRAQGIGVSAATAGADAWAKYGDETRGLLEDVAREGLGGGTPLFNYTPGQPLIGDPGDVAGVIARAPEAKEVPLTADEVEAMRNTHPEIVELAVEYFHKHNNEYPTKSQLVEAMKRGGWAQE